MPSDVHNVYAFPGRSFGNTLTCESQGFIITIGLAFGVCANVVLNVYYVCTLRYCMKDRTLNRRMLPIALVVSCMVSLPVGILPLVYDLLNPTPHEMYCSIGAIPDGCGDGEGQLECIRGGSAHPNTVANILLMITVLLGATFLLVVVSLIMVVLAVFKFEQASKKLEMECAGVQESSHTPPNKKSKSNIKFIAQADQEIQVQLQVADRQSFANTRLAGRVALMYIAAFFITWIWTIISMLPIAEIPGFSDKAWDVIGDLRSIFVPMQGFFNSIIFFYNKVHNLRREDARIELQSQLRGAHTDGDHYLDNLEADPRPTTPDKTDDRENCNTRERDVTHSNDQSQHMTFFRALKRVILSPRSVPPDMIISDTGMDILFADNNAREYMNNQVPSIAPKEEAEDEDADVDLSFDSSGWKHFDSIATPTLSNTGLSDVVLGNAAEGRHKCDQNESPERVFYPIFNVR